ncbi:MAG: hypothetical protein WA777_07140 [Rhodanobacter sp.]
MELGYTSSESTSVEAKIQAGVDVYQKWGMETGRLVSALYREANQQGFPAHKDRNRVGKNMLVLYQNQAELHRLQNDHPLVYQTLIAAKEYVSS